MVYASINVNNNSKGHDVLCHDSFGRFRAIKTSDNVNGATIKGARDHIGISICWSSKKMHFLNFKTI